jgi:hypothetical protein
VLIFVDSEKKALEIVTGSEARRRLPDERCRTAAMSMATVLSAGDLVGGIVTGVWMLAEQASRHP